MILTTDDGTSKILKTYIPILPKHIYGKETYEKIGDDPFKAPLVGTGQYMVVEYVPDEPVHFVRNPNYWGKKGFADEIIIQIFKNADTMVQALKTGDIEYARGVPVEQFNALKARTRASRPSPASPTAGSSSASTTTGPGRARRSRAAVRRPRRSRTSRSAMPSATPSTSRARSTRSSAATATSATTKCRRSSTPSRSAVRLAHRADEPRTFDIELAKQKLDAAGYTLDATGNRLDKEGKPISLHLVMPDSTRPTRRSPVHPGLVRAARDQGQVGRHRGELALRHHAAAGGRATADKAKYDMFIWSWYGGLDPNALLQIFLCDQIGTSSDSLWCNPDYDKLYDAAEPGAERPGSARSLMDQIQNLFYDQAPYHILYYDDELDAYRTDKFAGWQNQPLDTGVPLFTYSVIGYSFLTDAKGRDAGTVAGGARRVRQRRPPVAAAPGATAAPGGSGPAAATVGSRHPILIGGRRAGRHRRRRRRAFWPGDERTAGAKPKSERHGTATRR